MVLQKRGMVRGRLCMRRRLAAHLLCMLLPHFGMLLPPRRAHAAMRPPAPFPSRSLSIDTYRPSRPARPWLLTPYSLVNLSGFWAFKRYQFATSKGSTNSWKAMALRRKLPDMTSARARMLTATVASSWAVRRCRSCQKALSRILANDSTLTLGLRMRPIPLHAGRSRQ